MRNRKGFSLIELLGALVIIGLILLVVIPSVSRLLTNNDAKEYSNYLNIIETASKSYAKDKQDDLGGSSDVGCIEVSLEDLIKENYLKKFNDKKITCTGKVRINNNRGKEKISINLSCMDEKNKETFKKENISGDSCLAFIPEEGLVSQIMKNGLGSGSTGKYDNKTYIRGSNPNNYVWYSGKLWRVVWYDNTATKLISTDIVTIMNKSNANISYKNSLVESWLNNEFLKTLNDYNKYLVDTIWDVSPTGLPSSLPSLNTIVNSKVGLLNSYEVSKMGNFISGEYKWILSNYNGLKVRRATKSGAGYVTDEEYNSGNYYAIRPAITMKNDVIVISGNGSLELPYILEGNSTNVKEGTLLNARYSGEYLKINGVLYRIVKVKNNLTKVIMYDSLPASEYSSVDSNFAYSSVSNYLNNNWYNNSLGEDKELIFESGSWCSKVITAGIYFNEECIDSYTSPVGIPSIGDIYTANNDGKIDKFWTIDGYSDNEMNIIDKDTKKTLGITDKAMVKPVMYLKENVVITSGSGTKNEPFTLKLK